MSYVWDKVKIHINDQPRPKMEYIQSAVQVKKFFYNNSKDNSISLLFEYPNKWILIANDENGVHLGWAELKPEDDPIGLPEKLSTVKPTKLHIIEAANALIEDIYKYDIKIRKHIVEKYYQQGIGWEGLNSQWFLDEQYTKLLSHVEKLYVSQTQLAEFKRLAFKEEEHIKCEEVNKKIEEEKAVREVMLDADELEEYLG